MSDQDLRAKSDALLKRCGWEIDARGLWREPRKTAYVYKAEDRPHPYESIDDAVNLAEAMGLTVANINRAPYGNYKAILEGGGLHVGRGPTIAEAICASITAALGDPA